MKRAKVFIVIGIISAILICAYLYKIPYKIEGTYTVYDNYGESYPVKLSLEWSKFYFSEDVINGTIEFQGETFRSLDVLLYGERLKSGPMQFEMDLPSKISGHIIIYPFTNAPTYNQYWYKDYKYIIFWPMYNGDKSISLRDGEIAFSCSDENGSGEMYYTDISIFHKQ